MGQGQAVCVFPFPETELMPHVRTNAQVNIFSFAVERCSQLVAWDMDATPLACNTTQTASQICFILSQYQDCLPTREQIVLG